MFSRSQTETEAFKRWFGKSKVVDADGKPLVVYHGTNADFSAFDTGRLGAATNARTAALGFFSTDNELVANRFADATSGANVMPIYVSIQNPVELGYRTAKERSQSRAKDPFAAMQDAIANVAGKASWSQVTQEDVLAWKSRLVNRGYDGIILRKTVMDGDGGSTSRTIADPYHDFYIAFRPEQIKSATGNNGNFDPANPDIRYSFAGARAATADRHALASAQQRLDAGEDAEAVRQDTGWFKGADGKWRFEINDADAKLLKEPSDPGVYADIFDEAVSRSNGVPLGKVLDHPALFAAYPALKATRFIVDDQYGGNGSYSADENAIRVRDPYSYKNGPDQLLSVLLHEIQHGIQNIEGFATGGNQDSRADVMQAISQQRSLWADVYAVRRELDAGKKLDAVLEEWQEFLDAQPSAEALRIAQDPELETSVALQNMETLERQYAQLRIEGRGDTYRRLAGEVEARNTQARQGMTDEQRRATPPSQTADVADSDVIVMFNGKDAANAPAPANGMTLEQARRVIDSMTDGKPYLSPDLARRTAALQKAVEAIHSKWPNAPETVVVADMRDARIPRLVRDADAQQRSQGATGEPEGFFHAGKVYLVASQLHSPADAARVLAHESLGHYGLQGVFGDRFKPILNRVTLARRAEVIAKAREYGLVGDGVNVKTASDAEVWQSMTLGQRQQAAEEVLAVMAQTQPQSSFVRDAVAAIRAWLREHIPGFNNLRVTDDEIIREYILPARNWVERGRQSRVDGMPAFGRATNQPMATNNVAGQDQGGAPAGDNMGAPMTLFHGGKAVLSSLDGRGRKNRFLYTTPTEVMAKEYGQHVTRLVPDKDARIADLSDPEALYGSQTAVEAIQQYAQENDIDPDDLVAAVADGRAWETYGEYMQDDINDVVGAALGADIIALPDSTFASNPQVQGKTFVVLNKGKIKIASDSHASTSQDAPSLSRAAGGRGFDASNSTLVADFRNDEPLKRHADYKAAKAGDVDAAARLVRDVVKPESLEQSRRIFGPDAIFVPVHAQEASGKNQIPNMLALAHAQAAGASVEQDIKQSNKAFHTGAGAMERLMNRAEFDGAVEPGKSYVLVDDVTTMGSTLADLAAYIQRNGGHVAGSVVLVNAARGSKMQASPRVINQLEARHGQAIREILGIDAAQLTGPEADYLIGFKSADEIRNRATRAEQERSARLRAKEVLPGRPPGVEPKLSRAAVPGEAPDTRTAAQRAEDIIQDSAQTPAPLDAIAHILTKYTGVERLTRAAYRAGGRALDRAIPERIKAGVVADYGLPEAVKDQRVLLQARQRVQLRKSGKLVDQLSTLTRAESRIAYEGMNETDPQKIMRGMSALPEESVKVLQQVQQMIDKLSQDAVALGQLDPRSYERNKFAYLRRSYAKHILEQPGAKKARARAVAILGDQYKGRGITENASMAKVRQTAPEWWDVARRAGKADPDLIGRKLVKMERIAPTGAGTRALPGMEGRADGRVLETVYLPADRARPAQYRDWREAGTFEVRDTKANDLVLWRDYTKDEREQMGEVDEARFAIIKTLHGMIRDVETGRYLEWVAKTYGKPEGSEIDGNLVEGSERLRDTFLPGDWVKVPDTKIAGTQVAKYGKLAGKYVPGPVWNDVRSAVNINPKPLGEVYDKVLNAWKLSKTALSPTVHVNNVMSNFVMADWHGVTAGHIAKALRIIMAAHERKGVGAIGRAGNVAAAGIGIADREAATEIMTRYQDSGGELGSWVTNEIAQDQIQPLLDAMEKELANDPDSIEAQAGVMSALQLLRRGELGEAARAAAGAQGAKQIIQEGKNLIELYSNEDAVFRLAAWLKAKEGGASDLDAGKEARKSFLDYNINAPWVTAMRKSAWPFLAFTYRAIPMMLDVAAHKPHKLFKLMAIAGSLNALGTLLAGGDEDEEKRIRRMLPDEKAGGIWGAVPKLIRMPWNDDNGSPVFLDIRRWVPMGDVVDVGQGHSAIPMLPYLMPGGPLATAGELVLNRSQFTGKPITLDTDTPAQQAGKVLDYVYKAFAPNVLGLPGSYATTGVMDAAKGRTDAFGRERSKTQAVASSFGVKLGSYPADVLQRNLVAKSKAEIGEIDKNIGQLKRQAATKAITRDEFTEKVQVEQDKKREIARKLMEKVGG